MATVTYTRFGQTRSYTVVPLDKLDMIRGALRKDLKALEACTGTQYSIRTFFLGPRPFQPGTPAASTLKTNARAAKIGIYKVRYAGNYQYPITELVTYL